MSIKSCEQYIQGRKGSIRITAMRPEQKLPKQQKKYHSRLKQRGTSRDFFARLQQQPTSNQTDWRKGGVYNSNSWGLKIYYYNKILISQPVHKLSLNQEEADTKVFFAAKFTQEIGYRDAVIFTVDSSVAILACYFAQMLEINFLVQVGSGNN